MKKKVAPLRANSEPKLKDRPPSVPEILREAAKTFEQRQAEYGDNYKCYGKIMEGLFPEGIHIEPGDTATMQHLGLVHNCVHKLARYCYDIKRGHKNSAHDLSVYAAMLEELTDE